MPINSDDSMETKENEEQANDLDLEIQRTVEKAVTEPPPEPPAPVVTEKKETSKWVLSLILFGVFLVLTVWNLLQIRNVPASPYYEPAVYEKQVKTALYFGVLKIEAYRDEHQRLPDDLEDANLSPDEWSYEKINDSDYRLTIIDEPSMTYDSTTPIDQFFADVIQTIENRGGTT